MRNIHLFVWFAHGRTNFRVTGLPSGDYNGGDPASTYKHSTAMKDHYANLAGYVKQFQPNTIEIRNDLLS